ncbi:MAG: hypothetical protein EKK29_08370 [Hyphomicrobiales bacterium]|nr:MAG: hypothetical protein EKK29_08370 [Hyphomicrobiales bacterium]
MAEGDAPDAANPTQEEFVIQERLGRELRRSFEAMVEEPLPERMATLLIQVALAHALKLGYGEEVDR